MKEAHSGVDDGMVKRPAAGDLGGIGLDVWIDAHEDLAVFSLVNMLQFIHADWTVISQGAFRKVFD